MSILGLIDTLRARQPLRDVEAAQPETNTGYTHVNPSDVGPRQGEVTKWDGQANVGDTAAAGLQDATRTSFLGKTVDGAMTPDQVAQARGDARVSTMRQYGLYDAARTEEDAAAKQSQAIQQGRFYGARADAMQQEAEAAKAAALRDARLREIDNEFGARLKGITNPTEDDVMAMHRDRYMAYIGSGAIDQAAKPLGEFQALVQEKAAKQSGERKQAGVTALAAIEAGNFKPAVEWSNKYIPGGLGISDVQPSKKVGFVSVTISSGGKSHTQEMKIEDLKKTAVGVITQGSSPDAMQAVKFVTQQALDHAKTSAEAALAADRSAGAGKTAAEAKDIKQSAADRARLKELTARGGDDPRQNLTPSEYGEYKALLGPSSENGKFTFHDEKDATGAVTGVIRGNQRTGEVNRIPVAGLSSVQPSQGGKPSPSPSEAGSIPADPSKRVVGQVYTNAQGQRAKWTAEGKWQPM